MKPKRRQAKDKLHEKQQTNSMSPSNPSHPSNVERVIPITSFATDALSAFGGQRPNTYTYGVRPKFELPPTVKRPGRKPVFKPVVNPSKLA